jgi:hypothetical protein
MSFPAVSTLLARPSGACWRHVMRGSPSNQGDAKLHSALFMLGVFAAFLLFLALVLAWVLGITLFYPRGALSRRLADRNDIIRGHIDYLMMSQFLFLFFLAFKQYSIRPPLPIVTCLCFGAFFNPFAFVLRGLRGPPSAPPEEGFPVSAIASFSATTLGFLGATWLIIEAAWRSL